MITLLSARSRATYHHVSTFILGNRLKFVFNGDIIGSTMITDGQVAEVTVDSILSDYPA